MNQRFIASSALASVLALGLLSGAQAADENAKEKCFGVALACVLALGLLSGPKAPDEKAKEKCFGVAKAGQNDCANLSGTHSCAGQSKNEMGADEWKYVAKGTCAKMGGKNADEAKETLKK